MKKTTIALVLCLILALTGCGRSDDGDLSGAAQNFAAGIGSSGTDSSAADEDSKAEDAVGSSEDDEPADTDESVPDETETETSESNDAADTADLLKVEFFETREEALEAAGDDLKEMISIKPTEQENPMSWHYMAVTCLRDDTFVEFMKGSDGLTEGLSTGFEPTSAEFMDYMDKGEVLVSNVNVEWYPVFELRANDEIYKGTLPLGWSVYTSKEDNGGIPLPCMLTGNIIVRPIVMGQGMEILSDEKYENDKIYYCSIVEYLESDSLHPELNGRLDKIKTDHIKEYREGLGMLGLEARESYEKNHRDDYALYRKDLRTSLCRADDTVLSYVEYYNVNLDDLKMSDALGMNLDTKTGEDVLLTDVITDTDVFVSAVSDRCEKMGFDKPVCDAFTEVAQAYIDDKDYVSSLYFSWNICYEGIWLHFNDSVAKSVTDSVGGRNTVFLPFCEYQDLVNEHFTNVPSAYAYEIEIDPDFGDIYALDTDLNGMWEDFYVRDVRPDDQGWADSLEVGYCGEVRTITEGIDAIEIEALIVHNSAQHDYLYLCQPGGQGYGAITDYQLTMELYCEDTCDGVVQGVYTGENSGYPESVIMTDPGNFLLLLPDNKMGTRQIYAHFQTARNGSPELMDDYYLYTQADSWVPGVKNPLKLDMVDRSGKVTGAATLEPGTPLKPLRTDNRTYLDVTDQKGNIWRLKVQMGLGLYEVLVEDMEPNDLFDGLEYF